MERLIRELEQKIQDSYENIENITYTIEQIKQKNRSVILIERRFLYHKFARILTHKCTEQTCIENRAIEIKEFNEALAEFDRDFDIKNGRMFK